MGQIVRPLVGRVHHVGGLIAEGLGHLAVLSLHVLRRPVVLGLARLVRGDLRRRGAVLVLLLRDRPSICWRRGLDASR